MIKAYKAIALLLAVLMTAFVLCACEGGETDPKPADAANETQAAETEKAPDATEETGATPEPAETAEPIDTDGPAATEAPDELPYHEVIPLDAAYSIDLDGDGADESVLITSSADDEFDYNYSVSVTPGGGEPFAGSIGMGYDCYAMAVDNGAGDGGKALLICYWYDSEDYTTYLVRGNGQGGFEMTETFGYFANPADDPEACFINKNLCINMRTDIFGTQDIYTEVRFTEAGYESVDGLYYFYQYDDSFIPVIAELPVTVIDEQTGESYGMSLNPGSAIVPVSTDGATCAIVRLSSGEDAYIFFDDFDYIPYINGKPQEYYLDVMYSD